MSQIQQIQIPNNSPSLLDRFTIGFEYDKTIQQVKHDTKVRTI